MTISFPGSDALFSTAPSAAPAGYTTLGLQNYGASSTSASSSPSSSSGSSSSSSSSNGVNPYQRAYDGIIAASNAYLQNSLLNGPPSTLPLYAGGSTASAFAQLSTTLDALKQGLAQGIFAGTGFNALA